MSTSSVRYCLSETRRWFRDCNSFCKEAKRRFSSEKPAHGSFGDYLSALLQHRFTYDEYMNYALWECTPAKRTEFVSMAEMEMVYRRMVAPSVKSVFNNKVTFLKAFRNFVSRRWIFTPEGSLEDIKSMLSSMDCIAKPVSGHSGFDIRKISKANLEDVGGVAEELVSQGVLLEECVSACHEIEEFHPASLNTLRVVTISRGKDVRIIGAILRMGVNNSCIDNTHAGGVFAQIDIESGMIVSDGVDTNGSHYHSHPDSGKVIKGTQIPYWDKVRDLCVQASAVIPNLCFAGWDICLHENGVAELIEANAAPHFDGGMQVPLRKGVRAVVKNALHEMYGLDNLI